MMSEFQIGDKVEAVDDTTKGVVVAISEGWVTIESRDGFRLQYRPAELLRTSGQERLSVSSYDAALAKAEEARGARKRKPVPKRKERDAPKMEVDLHINQLVPTTRGLTNHDILSLQLDTARRQLEFAMQKRIRKVVFIHGVGEGTLREELLYLFGRYENVSYYDADYQKYGLGATEVYIRQN